MMRDNSLSDQSSRQVDIEIYMKYFGIGRREAEEFYEWVEDSNWQCYDHITRWVNLSDSSNTLVPVEEVYEKFKRE